MAQTTSQGNKNALVKKEEEQLAKIANSPDGKLKTLFARDDVMQTLKDCMHKDSNTEGVIKSFCVAASKSPDIYNCTNESKVRALLEAAEMGLSLTGPRGFAYLIPRNIKDANGNKVPTCCYQVGYLGYTELLFRHKTIKSFDFGTVYPGDHFIYQKGSDPKFVHEPSYENHKDLKPICHYVIFYMSNGTDVIHVMSYHDVMKRREVAQTKNVWDSWFEEMAAKTVIMDCARKKLSSSPEINMALDYDQENDFTNLSGGFTNISKLPKPKPLGLNKQMTQGDPEDHQGHPEYVKPRITTSKPYGEQINVTTGEVSETPMSEEEHSQLTDDGSKVNF